MAIKRVSPREIEAAKTAKGAWTRVQLAAWGVPWPPPKGWKKALITGDPAAMVIEHAKHQPDLLGEVDTCEPGAQKVVKVAFDEAMFRKVVVAIINRGHASDLYEFPDVLEYFGAQIPDGQHP